MRYGSIVLALLLAAVLLPSGSRAQWKTHWDYQGADGPARWGDLDPAYEACKNGRQQSPIDIEATHPADLPALRFEYKNGPLNIINNGYTAVRVNYPPGNGNTLVVGGERFELTQFHFHHPSEETLHGKPAAMAIHFMHADRTGRVAGVVVLVEAGAANATVDELWAHMPASAGKEQPIEGIRIDPAALLPKQLGYYRYAGSQTAPPCTEGVTWYVLKNPISMSAQAIEAFAKLYPHDVRPVQPLQGRVVDESR